MLLLVQIVSARLIYPIFFIDPWPLLQFEQKPSAWTLCHCKTLYGEMLYISCVYVLVFPWILFLSVMEPWFQWRKKESYNYKNTCTCCMNRFNSLWNMWKISTYIILIKRKKRKRYSVYNFLELMQHYERFWKTDKCNLTQVNYWHSLNKSWNETSKL